MDDALLLALASHAQLDLGREAAGAGGGIGLAMVAGAQRASSDNPHRQLWDAYSRMAEAAEAQGGPAYDFYVRQAEEHNRLAAELDAARAGRQGRQGRGLQRVLRAIARGPIQAVRAAGIGVKETLRLARTVVLVAAEEAPRLARQYIERKIRDVGALLQGRIDLVWDKLADRVGLPFAVWLRSRIDPAFVRARDRVLAGIRGGAAAAADPAANPEAPAGAAERASRYEQAGRMTATCEWPFLWNYTPADTLEIVDIPMQVEVDLNEDTLAYRFEYQGEYEDYSKCSYSLQVEGVGLLQQDDPWFQGTEIATRHLSCYLLNVATGEKIPTEDSTSSLEAEIAGAIDDDLRTLSLCYADPLGGIKAMMAAGRPALLGTGWCTPCTLLPPK